MNLKPALWLRDQIIKSCVFVSRKVYVRKVVLAIVVTTSVILAGLLIPPASVPETAEESAEPPSTELTQPEPTAEELEAKRLTDEHIEANNKITQKPAYEPIDIEYYKYLAEKYAEKYGADINWLKRVRFCESRDNHLNDNNPKCKGLYQFMPSTFYANAKRIGLENPDLWSADNQTEVAAYMQSIGQQGQWTCK